MCEPLREACERAQREERCAQDHLNAVLQHFGQAQVQLAAEIAAAQAAGNPAMAGLIQLTVAISETAQELASAHAAITASEARSACAAPTPQDPEVCRRAAQRVDDGVRRSRDELKRALERVAARLNAQSAAAAASPAGVRLIAAVETTLRTLDTCP
jgi:hypothetical protein